MVEFIWAYTFIVRVHNDRGAWWSTAGMVAGAEAKIAHLPPQPGSRKNELEVG